MRAQSHLQRGQNLIEYALILPIMMTGLVLFIDLGKIVYTRNVLSNAAREGVRFASPLDDTAEAQVESYIRNRVPGLNPDLILFDFDEDGEYWITWNECSKDFYVDTDGNKEIKTPGTVEIQLVYTVTSIILGNGFSTGAGSTMKMEVCP